MLVIIEQDSPCVSSLCSHFCVCSHLKSVAFSRSSFPSVKIFSKDQQRVSTSRFYRSEAEYLLLKRWKELSQIELLKIIISNSWLKFRHKCNLFLLLCFVPCGFCVLNASILYFRSCTINVSNKDLHFWPTHLLPSAQNHSISMILPYRCCCWLSVLIVKY